MENNTPPVQAQVPLANPAPAPAQLSVQSPTSNTPPQHYSGGALPGSIDYQFDDPSVKSTNDFINPFNDVNVPDAATQPVVQKDPVNSILDKLASAPVSRDTQSANANFDWDKTRADRYVNSDYYKELGFDPNADNETKYGDRQTWGNAMSQALVGGAKLAGQSFIQGWEGWGNLANALFNWDSNKSFEERLMGTPDELEAQNQKQEDVMNKYAIFQTPEDTDGVFNKHFIGNMIQQGGFAVGAVAQFLSEEFLTAGIATGLEGADLGVMMTKFGGKSVTASEAMADAVKVGAETYKDESIVSGLVGQAKKLIPLSDTASAMIKASKEGAGAMQMANIGLGGVKRALAEANMAFTQGRMLAAGTYGDLYGKLRQEYIDKNGQEPIGDDLNKIKDTAESAASNDFIVNSGIQLLTNRIQFSNILDKFGYERDVAKDAAQSMGKDLMQVSGKLVGDETGNITKQVYSKGITGALGTFKDIAADYGTKQAAWEITKDLGKGMFKWETAGGIHMLMQDVTNKSLQDYYYDLYKDPQHADFGKSLSNATKGEATMQGVQSFLMGALTGRLLSPFNSAMEGVAETVQRRLGPKPTEIGEDGVARTLSAKEVKERQQQDKQTTVDTLNQFFKDPGNALKENIKSFKVQSGAAEKMSSAATLGDQYYYSNAKDSALANVVAAAKKTDMLDSVLDTIKNYGDTFKDPQQFKDAFGLDQEEHSVPDIRQFFEKVSGKIKDYSKSYDKLMDKYSDLVQPELYKPGSEGHQDAMFAQKALHDSIEMLATDKFKGEQAAIRMTKIYNDLGKNPTIGPASQRAVEILGSEFHTKTEVDVLKGEISSMKLNPKPDFQVKQDIANKQNQLDALLKWQESYKAFQEKPREEQQKDPDMMSAYGSYLSAVHQENGHGYHIRFDDIDDGFNSVVDHVQLNKDNQDYTEAFNTIANPAFFKTMYGKIIDAQKAVAEQIKQEQIAKVGLTKNPFEKPVTVGDSTSTTVTNPAGTAEDLEEDLHNAYHEYTEEQADNGQPADSYSLWLKFNEHAQALKAVYSHISSDQISKTAPEMIITPPNVVTTPVVNAAGKSRTLIENGQVTDPHKIENTVLDQANFKDGVNGEVMTSHPEMFSNYKQINPASTIATKSDNYTVDKATGKRERTTTNQNYEQLLGTSAISIGTPVHFRADVDMKDFDQYNYLDTDEFTKRTKADYFDENNRIKPGMKDDFPIGIYTMVNGKEVQLGHVRTVKWLEAKAPDGSSLNVAEEREGLEDNVAHNIEQLRDFRNQFYTLHNEDPNFEHHETINNKSEGTIRINKNNTKTKISEAMHPETGLGVIKNGSVYLDKSSAMDVPEEDILKTGSFDGKDGWPVAILHTPTGRKFVTYLNLPKLESKHSDLIVEGWKAFHELIDQHEGGKDFDKNSAEYKLAQAIYKAYGSELSVNEKPSFKLLQRYVDDHITHLSSESYDTSKEGKSAFNITDAGKIFSWAIDKGQKDRDKETDKLVLNKPSELNTENSLKLNDLLSKLYYTVKLSGEDANGNYNHGLNSDKKKQFLSYEDGKLKMSKPRIYNDYMRDILETNLDKGVPVDPKDPNSPWNHFANPVTQFTRSEMKKPAANFDSNEPAPVAPNMVNTSDLKKGDSFTHDGQNYTVRSIGANIYNSFATHDIFGEDHALSKFPDKVEKNHPDGWRGSLPEQSETKQSLMDMAAKTKAPVDFSDLMGMDFGDQIKDFGIDNDFDVDPEDYASIRTVADRVVKEDPNTTRNCN
jgi:hypothetical protein